MEVYAMLRGLPVCALCAADKGCSGACAKQPYYGDQRNAGEHWSVCGILTMLYQDGEPIDAQFAPFLKGELDMKRKSNNNQAGSIRPGMKYFYFPIWPPHGEDLIGVALHFNVEKADEHTVHELLKGMLRGVFLADGPLRKEYYAQHYPEEPRWWGVVPDFHRQWVGRCECLACQSAREDELLHPVEAKAAADAIKKRVEPILEDLVQKGEAHKTSRGGYYFQEKRKE